MDKVHEMRRYLEYAGVQPIVSECVDVALKSPQSADNPVGFLAHLMGTVALGASLSPTTVGASEAPDDVKWLLEDAITQAVACILRERPPHALWRMAEFLGWSPPGPQPDAEMGGAPAGPLNALPPQTHGQVPQAQQTPPETAVPAQGSDAILDLSNRGLTSLPEGLNIHAKQLDIFSNQLTSLAGVEQLNALEEIQAYDNKLKNINAITSMPQLRTLNVYNNRISSIPEEAGRLENLQEVNVAGNKLMALSDKVFSGWHKVKVLNLFDNNLVKIGSLAPLMNLEELRLHANYLETMPILASNHPKLTIMEMHRNRVTEIPENYFLATPALQRLSLWKNMLTSVPTSLCACSALVALQLHENMLTGLPDGPWPLTLESLFLDKNTIATLPVSLSNCHALKRLSLCGLPLDFNSMHLADYLKGVVLRFDDGIFWSPDGTKHVHAP